MNEVTVIRNWDKHYENSRSRRLDSLSWFPIPNDLDNEGYLELLDHRDGEAHYAVWIQLLAVASKAKPRGALVRKLGGAHDAKSLARLTRLKERTISNALPRLLELGWLERVSMDQVRPPN